MTTRFDSQLIGRTENALRALLNRQLAGTGVTYPQWVALVLTAAPGGSGDRDQLTARVAGALQVDQAAAESHLDALAANGQIRIAPEPGSHVTVTETGQQLLNRVRPRAGEITQGLFGDLPAADLEAAGRVLSAVLERAEAQLRAGS